MPTPKNIPAILVFLIASALPTAAQIGTNDAKTETAVTSPISNGLSTFATVDPVLPNFTVLNTLVIEEDVVEPPPMPGLPPVTGTVTSTVRLVEDPGLPDPEPPVLAKPSDDPEAAARLAVLRANYQARTFVFVSATVYDHSRTLLRWHLNGSQKKSMSGWSNLDFNHFSGFSDYQVKGRDGKMRRYYLMMGVGNTDTRKASLRTNALLSPSQSSWPEGLPDLASGGPAFVVLDGDTSDPELMAVIEGMNDIYRTEGTRMAAAYEARVLAHERKKAWLLANPPAPKNLNVSFWQRPHPLRQSQAVTNEENTPRP